MNQNESYSKIYKNIDDFCEFIHMMNNPKIMIDQLELQKYTRYSTFSDWAPKISGYGFRAYFKSSNLNSLFNIKVEWNDVKLFPFTTVSDYMRSLTLVFEDEPEESKLRKALLKQLDISRYKFSNLEYFINDFVLSCIFEFKGNLPFDFFDVLASRLPDLKNKLPTSVHFSMVHENEHIRIKSYDFDKKEVICEFIKFSELIGNEAIVHGFEYMNYHFIVDSIAPNAFDKLRDIWRIHLPCTLTTLKANFWYCRGLKSIICRCHQYKDIGGVLFSSDLKNLIAYPPGHGNFYDVPDGVECIKKDAFKTCSTIEVLRLPSTLKLIETNAFYRCHNLKAIICDMPKSQCEIRGNFGAFGPMKLKYYYEDIK